MKARFKLLKAMLVLNEFTIKDLAGYSGLKENTAQTAFKGLKEYVDQVGEVESGQPGRPSIRYRLKDGKSRVLQDELDQLFADLHPTTAQTGSEAPAGVEEPLDLAIAEDTLISLFPETESEDEKRNLIKLAGISIKSASNELGKASDGSAEFRVMDARLRSTVVLKNLCLAELGEPVPVSVPALNKELIDIADELRRLDKYDHSVNLLKRLLNSSALVAKPARGLAKGAAAAAPVPSPAAQWAPVPTEVPIHHLTAGAVTVAAPAFLTLSYPTPEAAAAAFEVDGPSLAASRAQAQTVLNRAVKISQIKDQNHRLTESRKAAEEYEAHVGLDASRIEQVAEKLTDPAITRRDLANVPIEDEDFEVIACQPEFYFQKSVSKRAAQTRALFSILGFCKAAKEIRIGGGEPGRLARSLEARFESVSIYT